MLKKLSLMVVLLGHVLCGGAQNLSRGKVEKCRQTLMTEWKAAAAERHRVAWEERTVRVDDLSMPYWLAVYGSKPADGRSLWISLHGGGNTPAAVNDQQWENQKHLYRPAEGVYVAPRAPYNDWDMWCKPKLDAFYKALIEMCVAYLDVNPDKVYIMGYSAGGDGVWRMAPRMADTWAAASMMAGHPGDVSTLNLRNTPFMIWCGSEDAAYDRNRLDYERGLEMDSLHRADPGGYVHETHIMQGMGHWMNRADTAAVPWMARYRREPRPRRIVWQQEEVVRSHFYWLSAPADELRRGMTVRLTCNDNLIDLERCDYSSLTLWLDDRLIDLGRPVTVRMDGRVLFRGKLRRTADNLRRSLDERGDFSYMFPACVTVAVGVGRR